MQHGLAGVPIKPIGERDAMDDHQGYLQDSDGWKIVDAYGHCWDPEDYRLELESRAESEPAALDRPTIDVEPESVRDTEIHRELGR